MGTGNRMGAWMRYSSIEKWAWDNQSHGELYKGIYIYNHEISKSLYTSRFNLFYIDRVGNDGIYQSGHPDLAAKPLKSKVLRHHRRSRLLQQELPPQAMVRPIKSTHLGYIFNGYDPNI